MLAPERRTRADISVAVAITVAVVVALLVVWSISDARGTTSSPATRPVPAAAAADHVPTALHELWHAPDEVAERPLAVGGAVVTATGGTVTGRDPHTGEPLWTYQRDMPLCAIESQWSTTVATYRDQRGCSQTTQLTGDTGARRGARSSYMDKQVAESGDGTYIVSQGPDRLEVWRSDLVRTLEFGYVDAKVNPHTQPRKDCTLLSAQLGGGRLAVLERCPNEPADRLTMLNPAPKDSTVPEEYGTHVLAEPGANEPGARILAAGDNRVAVYLPGPQPLIAVYDGNGNPVTQIGLSQPLPDSASVVRVNTSLALYTGNSVIALQPTTFEPQWTAAGALGTPAILAGHLVLPVAEGLAVLDPATGAQQSVIPLARSDYHGEAISLLAMGATVLELRDGNIYAIGE
ncbi:Rv3212 family protein [Nocardia stercoris]|uniref:PQQ-binding-like beta-propeller repeat protein n=1 Tax=Nocardia stercoris TaxID=2483361 RepID=A0A3M2LCM2_9NOCA|nr:hypothetical protein [Nocardia stercoris]RMI35144.1 hypothetical protein EBN03_02225 [Nocardia stercoris]